MITRWKLKNFKSVYDETSLDFNKITLFAGANSSGKSTFIQSILLVAQTLGNQVFDRPVILNGPIARLGKFSDLASSQGDAQDIEIGFTVKPPEMDDSQRFARMVSGVKSSLFFRFGDPLDKAECDFAFNTEGRAIGKGDLPIQLQPKISKCILKTWQRDSATEETISIVARPTDDVESRATSALGPSVLTADEEQALSFVVTEPIYAKSRRFYTSDGPSEGPIVGCKFRHFLPQQYAILYDPIEAAANWVIEGILTADWRNLELINRTNVKLPSEFVSELSRLVERVVRDNLGKMNPLKRRRVQVGLGKLSGSTQDTASQIEAIRELMSSAGPEMIQNEIVTRKDDLMAIVDMVGERKMTLGFVPVGDHAFDATHAFQSQFSDFFRYLGPLRDEPKPLYPIEGATDPSSVGQKGEFTANVLDVHRQTVISYIPTETICAPDSDCHPVDALLTDAVNDWLRYMGIGQYIETKDQGMLGHELRVRTNREGVTHSLPHVGVGVSQVLPILVMALLAPQGSVLVFEQPELHLHPKVQTLLGDFLLSMAICNKQCIVETHSEYLVDRLRLRAALDDSDETAESLQLYFVEKTGNKSTYRKVKINEYGAIEDWPEGFFDEAPRISELILKTALMKRKRKKRS